MMRHRAIVDAFAAALFASSMVTLAGNASAQADEAQLSPIANRAFEQIGTCLQEDGAQLNVLYVLDASSSLAEDTDKSRLRGRILAQALDQLGNLSADREVYYAVSSFDLTYQERKPWTQLTTQNVADATAWAQDQYDWWGAGKATNWLAALQGGDQTMRESPAAKTACKMMIWLTDGGINVNGVKSDSQANVDALEQICATNPINGSPVDVPSVVNSLRSSGVHLVGVLLRSEEYLGTIQGAEKADELSRMSYMLPITESSGPVNNAAFAKGRGESFNYTCGTSPTPDTQASGALLLGSNPILLAYKFSDLANGIRGGTRIDVGSKFPATFEIEPGINFMSVQLAGAKWVLTDPSGAVVATSGAPSPNPNVSISQQGALANIQVKGDVVVPGKWKLEVDDPLAPAQVYVDVLIDFKPDIPKLKAGEQADITISLMDQITNEPATASDFQAPIAEVTVQQGAQGKVALDCVIQGQALVFTCPYTPPAVGPATIKASVTLTTLSGKDSIHYNREFHKDVAPEASFPQVAPAVVELSDLDGHHGQAMGSLTLQGPVEGDGQVCFPKLTEVVVVNDAIDRSAGYSYSGPTWGLCYDVAQGKTLKVPITVTNEAVATGSVEVAFPVKLRSSSSQRIAPQEVRLEFDTIRQGAPAPWILLLLVALGVIAPIALLYAQASGASRLALKGLQTAVIPVRLTIADDIVRVVRQAPLGSALFQLNDWQYLPNSNARPRRFASASGVQLAAKTPRNPIGPLSAEAIAPAGSRVLTSQGRPVDGVRARLGLNPANEWFMVASEAELLSSSQEVSATLVGFANPTGGSMEEVNSELSDKAQDGTLLTGWSTIRTRLQKGETLKSSNKKKAAKKARSDKAVSAGAGASTTEPTAPGKPRGPFDDLGSQAGSPAEAPQFGRSAAEPAFPPTATPPPPSNPGGLSNPFENL